MRRFLWIVVSLFALGVLAYAVVGFVGSRLGLSGGGEPTDLPRVVPDVEGVVPAVDGRAARVREPRHAERGPFASRGPHWCGRVVSASTKRSLAAEVHIEAAVYRSFRVAGFCIPDSVLRGQSVTVQSDGYIEAVVSPASVARLRSIGGAIELAPSGQVDVVAVDSGGEAVVGATVWSLAANRYVDVGQTQPSGHLQVALHGVSEFYATTQWGSSDVADAREGVTCRLVVRRWPRVRVLHKDDALSGARVECHLRAHQGLIWQDESDDKGIVVVHGPFASYDVVVRDPDGLAASSARGNLGYSALLDPYTQTADGVIDLRFKSLVVYEASVVSSGSGAPVMGATVRTQVQFRQWVLDVRTATTDARGRASWYLAAPAERARRFRLKVSAVGYRDADFAAWTGRSKRLICALEPLQGSRSTLRIRVHEEASVRLVLRSGDATLFDQETRGEVEADVPSAPGAGDVLDVAVRGHSLGSCSVGPTGVLDVAERLGKVLLSQSDADWVLVPRDDTAHPIAPVTAMNSLVWVNLLPGIYDLRLRGSPAGLGVGSRGISVAGGKVVRVRPRLRPRSLRGKVVGLGSRSDVRVVVAAGWKDAKQVVWVDWRRSVAVRDGGLFTLPVVGDPDFLVVGFRDRLADYHSLAIANASASVIVARVRNLEVRLNGAGEKDVWLCNFDWVDRGVHVQLSRRIVRFVGPGPHVLTLVPDRVVSLTAVVDGKAIKVDLDGARTVAFR